MTGACPPQLEPTQEVRFAAVMYGGDIIVEVGADGKTLATMTNRRQSWRVLASVYGLINVRMDRDRKKS